jgi:hypothetical protein
MTILLFALLTVCFLAAGWPVVWAPVFARARLGLSGASCVGLGTGIVAAAVSLFPAANAGRVLADEKQDETVKVEADDPVIGERDDEIEIPPGRPEWVGAKPSLSGKVHTISVASGPYATKKQSQAAFDKALAKAMKEYVAEQLGSETAARMVTYDVATIKRRFVKDKTYSDEAKYSVGKMHESFALLEFDSKFRGELTRQWNQVRAKSRLLSMGVFSGAALLLVASVFSYFRADNATRGYYTGRLQIMTAAAILAVVGAGTLIVHKIPWL